jgi:hypothetical protein
MMSCETFRTQFHADAEDAALLTHLRTCDRCLDFAASVDPDAMFRALGGEDIVPPGGVDAFVDDVMRQVRVRSAEKTVVAMHPANSWTRRLAIAATVAAAVTGATFVYRGNGTVDPSSMHVTRAHITRQQAPLTTKPVVQTYESDSATIMEVPLDQSNNQNDDVKIVMIFDESLPADL